MFTTITFYNELYSQLATSIVQIWLSKGNLDRSIIQEKVSFNLKLSLIVDRINFGSTK